MAQALPRTKVPLVEGWSWEPLNQTENWLSKVVTAFGKSLKLCHFSYDQEMYKEELLLSFKAISCQILWDCGGGVGGKRTPRVWENTHVTTAAADLSRHSVSPVDVDDVAAPSTPGHSNNPQPFLHPVFTITYLETASLSPFLLLWCFFNQEKRDLLWLPIVMTDPGCQLDIPAKRNPQWKNFLHQNGWWACLWGISLTGNWFLFFRNGQCGRHCTIQVSSVWSQWDLWLVSAQECFHCRPESFLEAQHLKFTQSLYMINDQAVQST